MIGNCPQELWDELHLLSDSAIHDFYSLYHADLTFRVISSGQISPDCYVWGETNYTQHRVNQAQRLTSYISRAQAEHTLLNS
jgi:hypothetical protein